MNKKAIFIPTLALATLFLLTSAYLILIVNQSDLKDFNRIGDNQIALTNAYKQAENDLFYNEQAIKYALQQASKEFADAGGVKASCDGRWIFEDENCNPDLEKNFESLLKEKLQKYNLELQEFKIENDKVNVKLKDKVYSNKMKNFEYTYTVKQEFNQESFLNFAELINIREELLKCVISDIKISSCTKENFNKIQDNIYFTIENNKNVYTLTPAPGFKKLELKFNINEQTPNKRGL